MAKINTHFQKLSAHYLFPRIEKQVSLLKEKRPEAELIDFGIGDVSEPLAEGLVKALCASALEMGSKNTFKGYGPSQGYPFLREEIARHDYKGLGIHPDEIFISDGSKSDTANIHELFDQSSIVALPDPAYPVYVDATVMAGRSMGATSSGTYEGIHYLSCTEKNGFMPSPPASHTDLIYLCSPNNPTGVALPKELLQEWVRYAKKEKAVLLFDAAYEAYISSDAPHSIYEIEGAKDVAIEFRSYSKSSGFTGLRCAFTVIPKTLLLDSHSLHALWKRRSDTKFNGVSYIIQKAAAATYSSPCKEEIQAQITSYKKRTSLLMQGLQSLGYTIYGGKDAPYIWCKAPMGLSSWAFFDLLLQEAHIIAIPGSGFGPCGEGYVRFAAFKEEKIIEKSLKRFMNLSKKIENIQR